MAHPPDPALARAVGEVIKRLRGDGWSTRDIATRFDVADSTITRWENGDRTPRLDQLPQLDALCDEPKGYVLRLADLVTDDFDVEGALASDPSLDADGRGMVVRLYRMLRDDAAQNGQSPANSR
jgi:transcriptional regulator with XRE-family HTH domain